MSTEIKKLSKAGLGVGVGAAWAIGVLAIGLFAWLLGIGLTMVEGLSIYYIGFSPSLLGIIIGTIWAFIDGFIGGVIIAFFYNLVACQCHKLD